MKQGRQREPNVKTLRPPLSFEFWGHCVLSGRTQRRALPQHKSEEVKILNISYPRESNPQSGAGYSQTLVPLRHDWPLYIFLSKGI